MTPGSNPTPALCPSAERAGQSQFPADRPNPLSAGSPSARAASIHGSAGKLVMIGVGGGAVLPFVFHAAPTAALCRTAQSEN